LWDDIGVTDGPQPFLPAPADAPWRPAAVVHHATDAGAHFDLLLARREPSGPDDHACATWRAAHDPSALPVGGTTTLEPIADHRAHYLRLAAPTELSSGRGWVRPVAQGDWRPCVDGAVEIRWSGGTAARYRVDAGGSPPALLRRIPR
jgi:hypothetical protein